MQLTARQYRRCRHVRCESWSSSGWRYVVVVALEPCEDGGIATATKGAAEELHTNDREDKLKDEDDAENVANGRQGLEERGDDEPHSSVTRDETQRAQHARDSQDAQRLQLRYRLGEQQNQRDYHDTKVELVPRGLEVSVLGEEEAKRNHLGHHLTEEEASEDDVHLLQRVRQIGSRVEARRIECEADRRDDDGSDDHLVKLRLGDELPAEASERVAWPKAAERVLLGPRWVGVSGRFAVWQSLAVVVTGVRVVACLVTFLRVAARVGRVSSTLRSPAREPVARRARDR